MWRRSTTAADRLARLGCRGCRSVSGVPRIGQLVTVRQVVDAHAKHSDRYRPPDYGASWNTLGKLVRQQVFWQVRPRIYYVPCRRSARLGIITLTPFTGHTTAAETVYSTYKVRGEFKAPRGTILPASHQSTERSTRGPWHTRKASRGAR